MSYTFFGVQIAIEAFYKDPFRRRLHEVIAGSSTAQSLHDKRTFWKQVTAVVNEAMPVFAYGTWDLITTSNAEAEFETWCAELEGSLATEAQELGTAVDEVNRSSADKSHVLVTLLVLVDQDSNSDLTLRERCDIPEPAYFTRQTFARLVATFPLLNFANVQADAVYLVPGNEQDGLSDDDLHGGGYEYLKPLA